MKLVFLRSVLAIAALVITNSAVAFAQPASGTDLSADLKRRGDELMHSGDYKGALALYDEAYGLDPNPAIQYNRARALEAMGDWVRALGALERFDQDAPAELKARVPRLEALMKEHKAHVASVAVTSNVAGAAIFVRDKQEGTTPLSSPLRTNAGTATLEVRADGYQPFRVSMDLPGGSLTTIDAPLLKVGEKAPPPPPTTTTASKRSKVPSIVLAGGAVLLAGAGALMFGLRESDASALNKACPGGLCPIDREKSLTAQRDRALIEGPLGAAFFIGAGVTLGVAVLLWPFGSGKTTSAHLTFGDRFVAMDGVF